MPKLNVVVASTRPGRIGYPVAQWFVDLAREHGGFDVELVDLAEVNLPLLDEPNHPRLGQYVHDHTKRWSASVDAADAFVFVTPEYNYGMPASLKNAIDYLHTEWQYKPVGFVSYGGISAGTRAVQMTKQVVTTLKMTSAAEAVSIPFVSQFLDDDGAIQANEIMESSAKGCSTSSCATRTRWRRCAGTERGVTPTRGLLGSVAELRPQSTKATSPLSTTVCRWLPSLAMTSASAGPWVPPAQMTHSPSGDLLRSNPSTPPWVSRTRCLNAGSLHWMHLAGTRRPVPLRKPVGGGAVGP